MRGHNPAPISGGFGSALLPSQSSAAVLGSVSTRPEPHLSIQYLRKKSPALGFSAPVALEAPIPAPSLAAFTCAVAQGACGHAANRGAERRAGEWEGLPRQPDAQTLCFLFRLGFGALAER